MWNGSNAEPRSSHTPTSEAKISLNIALLVGSYPFRQQYSTYNNKTTDLAEHTTSTFGCSYKKMFCFLNPYEQGH